MVKIGYSNRDPQYRANELAGTGIPFDYEVEYEVLVDNARKIEKAVHKRLSKKRVSFKREWFECTKEEAIEHIRKASSEILLEQDFSKGKKVESSGGGQKFLPVPVKEKTNTTKELIEKHEAFARQQEQERRAAERRAQKDLERQRNKTILEEMFKKDFDVLEKEMRKIINIHTAFLSVVIGYIWSFSAYGFVIKALILGPFMGLIPGVLLAQVTSRYSTKYQSISQKEKVQRQILSDKLNRY